MKKFFSSISCALLLGGLLGFTAAIAPGCASHLAPAGAYHGDTTLYDADVAILASYDLLHAFVQWEFTNRASLAQWPEIRQAADTVRKNAEKWDAAAEALRDAYAGNPTAANRTALSTGLSVLQAASAQASKFLVEHPTTPAPAH